MHQGAKERGKVANLTERKQYFRQDFCILNAESSGHFKCQNPGISNPAKLTGAYDVMYQNFTSNFLIIKTRGNYPLMRFSAVFQLSFTIDLS